jgi:hypothetical protein
MRLRFSAATALGVWLAASAPGQAAENFNRLIQAAYFSDACRHEAAALAIAATADADALFAAFARQLATVSRAHQPDVLGEECKAPLVLLINLLRSNGIDAALAFISMRRTDAEACGQDRSCDRLCAGARPIFRSFAGAGKAKRH